MKRQHERMYRKKYHKGLEMLNRWETTITSNNELQKFAQKCRCQLAQHNSQCTYCYTQMSTTQEQQIQSEKPIVLLDI